MNWQRVHGSWSLLIVLFIGSSIAVPHGSPSVLESSDTGTESSASTAEVLRNVQKILSISRPLGVKTKFVKQATQNEADQEGAANALAYLTDSFGGQLAGQILSVILSSVTGDVRGILGNSLNLFQTDDRRDRVQFFLDDISHNFLKFTGLSALTTTAKPLGGQSTPFSLLFAADNSPTQIHPVQPQQAFPIASLGSGASLGSASSVGALGGSGAAGLSGLNGLNGLTTAQLQQKLNELKGQTKPQQASGAGQPQPIIYVLPPNSGSSSASVGTTATKLTTGTKGISVTNTADEDSDEDRNLWRDNYTN